MKTGDSLSDNVSIVVDTNPNVNTYKKCRDCNEGDMHISSYGSCTSYGVWKWHVCKKPSISECPIIGGVGARYAAAFSPYKAGAGTPDDPRLVCTYKVGDFADKGDNAVREWMKFRNAPNGWDPNLMTEYCNTTEYGTTKPNMMTRALCHEWADSPTGRGGADAAMISWCNKNPYSKHCGCLKRQQNETYNKISNAFSVIKDECWYKPCQDREMMSNLNLYDARHPTCPDNVCVQLVNIINSENVDINDLSMVQDCGSVPPPPPNPDPPVPPIIDDNNIDTKRRILIAISIGISGLGIAALLFAILKK